MQQPASGTKDKNNSKMNELQKARDTQVSIQQTLQKLSKTKPADLTPSAAFTSGMNVRKAYRMAPQETTMAMAAMIDSTCKYIDANKSIQGAEAVAECARYLLDQFPAFTLEEWMLVLYRVRHGYYAKQYGDRYKIFERLKTEELARFACKHEEERSYLLEEIHRPAPSRGLPMGVETTAIKYQPSGKKGSGTRIREYFEKVMPENKTND